MCVSFFSTQFVSLCSTITEWHMSYIPNVCTNAHIHIEYQLLWSDCKCKWTAEFSKLLQYQISRNPVRSSQPVTYIQLGMTQFLRGIPLSPHYCIPSSPNRSASTSQWTLSLSTSAWTYRHWQMDRNIMMCAGKWSVTARGRCAAGSTNGLLWHSLWHIFVTFCCRHTNRETNKTQKGINHTTVFIPTYWKFTPVCKTFLWWTHLEFVQRTNKSTVFHFSTPN